MNNHNIEGFEWEVIINNELVGISTRDIDRHKIVERYMTINSNIDYADVEIKFNLINFKK